MAKLYPFEVYKEINSAFPKLNRTNKINLPLIALGIRPGYFYESNYTKVIGKTQKLWGVKSPFLWNMYYPSYVNTPTRKNVWDKYFSKLIAISEMSGYLLVKKGKGKKIRDMMKKKLDKLYQKVPYRTPYKKDFQNYIESNYLQKIYFPKFHPIVGKLLGYGKFVSNLKDKKSGHGYHFVIFPKKYSIKRYAKGGVYSVFDISRRIKGKDSLVKLKADDKVIYNMAKKMDKGLVNKVPELEITAYREKNGTKTIIYDTYPMKKIRKKKTSKNKSKKKIKKTTKKKFT